MHSVAQASLLFGPINTAIILWLAPTSTAKGLEEECPAALFLYFLYKLIKSVCQEGKYPSAFSAFRDGERNNSFCTKQMLTSQQV